MSLDLDGANKTTSLQLGGFLMDAIPPYKGVISSCLRVSRK